MEQFIGVIVAEIRATPFDDKKICLEETKKLVGEIDIIQFKNLFNYFTMNPQIITITIKSIEDFILNKVSVKEDYLLFLSTILSIFQGVNEIDFSASFLSDQIIDIICLILKITFCILPSYKALIVELYSLIDLINKLIKLQIKDSVGCRINLLKCFPCLVCK